jgi:hypothetical protein
MENNITMENPSGYSGIHNARGMIADMEMGMFRTADEMTRKTTFLGAYRKAVSEGESHAAAMEYAKKVNNDVNYDYSIADTPNFMRRSGPIGTLAFQFKKYPIKTMELFSKLDTKQKTGYAARFILLSGILGLPGLDWLKDFIKSVWGPDIELEVKRLVSESPLPAPVKRTVLYGALSNAGVDVGRRVGLADAFPSEFKDLTGPAAATIARVIKSMPAIFDDGNFLDTIDAISPGLSNPLKALYGETRDQRGRTRFKYEGAAEKAQRALGFRPMREALESDAIRIANYEQAKRSEIETAAIDRYIEAYGEARGTPEYQEAKRRMAELGIDFDRAFAEMKKRRQGSAFERKMKEGKTRKADEKRQFMSSYGGM